MNKDQTPFQLAWIDEEPPAMAAAIRVAHETFDEFRRNVELENFRKIPAFTDILVKVRVMDRQTGRCEHVFLSRPVISAITIVGIVVSQPQIVKESKPGESMNVPISDLTDWILLSNKQGIGGFTVDVLKAQVPTERLSDYTASPPVSWFNYRVGSGVEMFRSLPVCVQCGQREPIGPPYVDGICGLCKGGGKRTTCPGCGVPLFRYPGAPDNCHTCLYGRPASRPASRVVRSATKKWWQFWRH